MTLPSSGTITLAAVATELGRPGTTVTLAGTGTDGDVKTLVSYSGSGAVTLPDDFYGKSAFTPYPDVIDMPGTGSMTIPGVIGVTPGPSSVTIQVIGTGGNGGNQSVDSGGGGAGGGGGAQKTYSISQSDWGTTIGYTINPAAAGFDNTVSGG